MPSLRSSRPTHLSLFVSDPVSGQPVARLPPYAEVGVPRIVPVPALPSDTRVFEVIIAALDAVDPKTTGEVSHRVAQAAQEALGEVVETTSLDALAKDFQKLKKLFERVFKEVLAKAGRKHMATIKLPELKRLITDALRAAAEDFDLALVPEVEDSGVHWADPLGVLTTDHVEYASFDLRRLRPDVYEMLVAAIEKRRKDPAAVLELAIWVYPYGHPGRFDALAQGRFAYDAVVARLPVKFLPLPPALQNMGPRALQNPGLTDWRLSPASFAASPKTLVGEHGCEELAPASLALQEFVLRQVVRILDPQELQVPKDGKAAWIDEYKVSWYSLGHSLGEILYSLPLAPGESVKLAVVDWSWDSLTQRDEKTRLTEDVLHQTHRDRTITETVRAGLQELQRGASIMGGMAHSSGQSSGASGGFGIGPIGIGLGAGSAIGDAHSLGGAAATSEGSRDLVAENIQRLSDSFAQASSAQREINSTVVIQARQEEKESIQTRTFSNYNHSHTLTVLYYEVLRHFRVTVEWVRRRHAVLLQIPTRIGPFDPNIFPGFAYDPTVLLEYRYLLEPTLLDPALKPAFDAVEKLETTRRNQWLRKITPGTTPYLESYNGVSLFEFGLRTAGGPTDDTDETVMINLILVDGTKVSRPLVRAWEKGNPTENVNVGKRLDYNNEWGWFIAEPDHLPDHGIKWNQLMGFEFVLHDNDEWRMNGLAINGFHAGGKVSLLDMTDNITYWFPFNGSSNTVTYIKRPGPKPAEIHVRTVEYQRLTRPQARGR